MARSREQRVRDTLEGLRSEVDVWVATASGDGRPYLVPLSFYWSGQAEGSSCRSGHTRGNVVVIDAQVEEMPVGVDVDLEVAYVQATNFDPRPWDAGYTFFRLVPDRIQAWRGDDAEELRDRDVMREGVFL